MDMTSDAMVAESLAYEATLAAAKHAEQVGVFLDDVTGGMSDASQVALAHFWVGKGPLVTTMAERGWIRTPAAFIAMLRNAYQFVEHLPVAPSGDTVMLPRRLGWLLVVEAHLHRHVTAAGLDAAVGRGLNVS